MAIELVNSEGRKLVFNETKSLNVDFSVNQVGEIETRNGIKSADFTVSLAGENLAFLGIANNVHTQIGSFKINCVLKQNGVQLAAGFVQIQSVDIPNNEATLTFFGGNVQWFEAVKQTNLRDLDLEDLIHNWNYASISASWAHNWENGYTYPFLNYGRLTSLSAIPIGAGFYEFRTVLADWYPAVYVKNILTRIGKTIGYTFGGEFWGSLEMEKMLLPFSPNTEPNIYSEADIANVSITGRSRDANLSKDFSFTSGSGFVNLVFPSVTPFISNYNFTTQEYTVTKKGLYSVVIGNSLQAQGTPFSGTLQIRSNTTPIAEATLIANGGGRAVFTTVLFEVGDVLTFYASPTVTATGVNLSVVVVLLSGGFVSGQPVNLSATLPDITASDLIKTIANMFGLMFQVNEYSRVIEMFTFEYVKRNIKNALDFSGKMSFDKNEISYTQVAENYAKVINFKWKEISSDFETDYMQYNEDVSVAFGDGFLEIENDFLENKKDFFESIFSICTMGGAFSDSFAIPNIFMYNQSENTYTDTTTPRILFDWGQAVFSTNLFNGDASTYTAWDLKLDANTIGDGITIIKYAYSFVQSDFFTNFGEVAFASKQVPTTLWQPLATIENGGYTLLGKWYRTINAFLNDNKLISAKLRLTEIDIHNVYFSLPVYLGYPYYSYFFISLIKQYNPDELLTEVELVRIA